MDAARGDAEIDRDAGAEFDEASRIWTPCGSRVIPKKPPPPNRLDREVEGLLAGEELKRTLTGLPDEGNGETRAQTQVAEGETPTAMFGSATEKPASMPCGVMSRCGGSEKPSSGIRSLQRSTKLNGPTNFMSSAAHRRPSSRRYRR